MCGRDVRGPLADVTLLSTSHLAKYRAGDRAGARDHLTRMVGSRYDTDWYAWLAEVR